MEKLDLTEIWSRYRRLEERHQLTPVVVRRMVRERAQGTLSRMVNYGYASVLTYLGVIVLFVVSTIMYGADARYLVCGLAGIGLSLTGLVWSVVLLRKMRTIDFATDAFVQVTEGIGDVKRLLRFEMQAQFVYMPMFLACVFPPVYRLVQNINVFEAFGRVAFRMGLAYLLITVISVWLYRRYFFRHLDLASDEIREAEGLSKTQE